MAFELNAINLVLLEFFPAQLEFGSEDQVLLYSFLLSYSIEEGGHTIESNEGTQLKDLQSII